MVDQVFAEPEQAPALARDFTLEAGLYLFAMFRMELLAWDAHKIRLLDAVLARASERFPGSERAEYEKSVDRIARRLWGVAHVTPFLRERFREPAFCDGTPERYPEFVELPTGELVPAVGLEGQGEALSPPRQSVQ